MASTTLGLMPLLIDATSPLLSGRLKRRLHTKSRRSSSTPARAGPGLTTLAAHMVSDCLVKQKQLFQGFDSTLEPFNVFLQRFHSLMQCELHAFNVTSPNPKLERKWQGNPWWLKTTKNDKRSGPQAGRAGTNPGLSLQLFFLRRAQFGKRRRLDTSSFDDISQRFSGSASLSHTPPSPQTVAFQSQALSFGRGVSPQESLSWPFDLGRAPLGTFLGHALPCKKMTFSMPPASARPRFRRCWGRSVLNKKASLKPPPTANRTSRDTNQTTLALMAVLHRVRLPLCPAKH